MRHTYVLIYLAAICSYFCKSYSMNQYEFDVAGIDRRIDQAHSAHELLPITIELIGAARFVAERIQFTTDDTRMSDPCYVNQTFANGRAIDELYKKYFLNGNADEYFRSLREKGILDSALYAYAYANFRKKIKKNIIDSYFKIDDRERWLRHLTECRQKMCNALRLDPHLGQEIVVEGVCLLAQFNSDLGSLTCMDSDSLEDSMLKPYLQNSNHALYDVLTILCREKKKEDASDQSTELAPPAFLNDYWLMRYYGRDLTNDPLYKKYPRRAMVERFGIYEFIRLVPMPQQTSCIVKKDI